MVELGCGNGRDGMAFAKTNIPYLGIDQSSSAIKSAQARFDAAYVSSDVAQLVVGDFSSFSFDSVTAKRLVIYSRFSLHAISETKEDELIDQMRSFKGDALTILIECRTVFDDLYGCGTQVERNAFLTDHYRRFIDPREFVDKMRTAFDLEYLQITNGLAVYGDEDPIVMRAKFALARA